MERMYTPFIHVSFSMLKTAGARFTRSSEKLATICSRFTTSVWPSSDQPSSARKFTAASARKPWSRYASAESAPCRFESLARSGPRIIGRCPKSGGFHPRAL